MALTEAQITDVRRFAGYQLGGTPALTKNNDIAYLVFGTRQMSLTERLETLSASEESVLVNTYLTKITALEQAILDAGDNLDTAQAAVWTRNALEVQDRERLFDTWRRRMCAFLGCAPGPGLGKGGVTVARG